MAHHEQQPIEAPSANRTVDLHNHQSMTNGSSRSATHNPVHLRTPSGGNSHHRQTFSESLRGIPPSPRGQRHPSFSQNALHELINNPPVLHNGGAKFAGRDWRTITVDEITDPEEVRFVEQTTSIEDATKLLVEAGAPNVVLIREDASSRVAIGTFDYSDLNAYLLLVVGLTRPDEDHIQSFNELARKAREGRDIPMKDVKDLWGKEPFMAIPHTENLTKAVEVLGSGVHRILLVKEDTREVVGVLTQLRLVRFFWENKTHFPTFEPLYHATLQDLNLGTHSVLAIHAERHVTDALELMNNEGITSLPVLDNHGNVVGNISHVDVRLLTKSTSLPLLRSSCLHFISVILSERGVVDGKDSYPVFHVSPHSTLAHTVAKLVATRSHRMWITDCQSPYSSGPPTPGVATPSQSSVFVPASANNSHATAPASPATSMLPSTIQSGMSGRLCGVVSLTDILNLYARATGLRPEDPNELRRSRRERSSSSSVRRSVDSARSGSVSVGPERSGGELGRSASMRGNNGRR